MLAMMRRSEGSGAGNWAKQWVFGLNVVAAGASKSASVDIELSAASVSRWDSAAKSFKIATGNYTISILDGVGEIRISVV